ncbi:MAG: UDP-N-acetylmuramoyl-L-alanine--D-glutamate ligase [Myxococcota bacterium]
MDLQSWRAACEQALGDLKGAAVAVVGAGRSGLAACRLLCRLQAHVHLLDDAPESELQSRLKQYQNMSQVRVHAAGIKLQQLQRAQLVVLSPGVPRTHSAIQAVLQQKIPVVTELDLAAHHLPNCRFIGVTGTNGKSTVTHLLGQMLKADQQNVFVGGNLGTPLCEVLLGDTKPAIAVLELSSFQLETLVTLPLSAAVVTNIAVDHADRYPSHEHYVRAKQRIVDLLQPGATLVCSSQDSHCVQLGKQQATRGPVVFVPALQNSIKKQTLQQTNAAFAVCMAKRFGATSPCIQQVLKDAKGLPHRFETLGCVQDVTFINDSKATNVAAALAALRSIEQGGVHWIVGGQGKSENYEPLVQACQHSNVKRVYVIGQETPALLHCFAKGQAWVQTVDAHTLQQAVQLAWQRATKGDVILLAPACASFDQFANFEQRGRAFGQLYERFKQRATA